MSRFQYPTPELRAIALAHLARTGDLPSLRSIRPPPIVPTVTLPPQVRHHVTWKAEYERVKKLPKLPPPTDPRKLQEREQYRREVRDVARRHKRRQDRKAGLPVDDSTLVELSITDDATEDSALVAAEEDRIEREVRQKVANGDLEISVMLPPGKMKLVTDRWCKTEPSETDDGSEEDSAFWAAEEAQCAQIRADIRQKVANGEMEFSGVLPPSRPKRDIPEPPQPEPPQSGPLLTKEQFETNFEKNHQKFEGFIAARANESPTAKAKRSLRIQERAEAKAAKRRGLWDTITSTISSSISLTTNSLLWSNATTDETTEDAGREAAEDPREDDVSEKSGLLSKTAESITMSLTRMWRTLINKAGFPSA